MKKGKVLIVGGSGVIGNAALEQFVSSEWETISISRRLPECLSGDFQHISLDLRDTKECKKIFSKINGITHIIYTALFEKPGLISGWYEKDQMETNLQMMKNVLEPICSSNRNLKHITFLQGTKAYGVHFHSIPTPSRENLRRDENDNFYWLQEDYVKNLQKEYNWNWTIFRPQIVFGYSYGTAMNLIPVLGAYASICNETNEPFIFTGKPNAILEATDAKLIAKACEWAALNKESENEIFNITNGDVFTWTDVWPSLADNLNIKYSKPSRDLFKLSEWLQERSNIWKTVVEKYNLKNISLSELLGESHHYIDFCFGYNSPDKIPPAIVSTIKLRKAGFNECVDTEEMLNNYLTELKERNIIPFF